MSLQRVLGWFLNWPRVSAAWTSLSQPKAAYVVEKAPVVGISVRHTVHATIFRGPGVVMVNPGGYYDSKRIYVPGIISETVYTVPEADDFQDAEALLRGQLGMRDMWSEVIGKTKTLRAGVEVFPCDVVEYRERLWPA